MPKKLTTHEFVQRARKVHGKKYDYSRVGYEGASSKVQIVCLRHGLFLQTPYARAHGQGCPRCGYERTAQSKFNTREQFIRKAKQTHGNKYDYSRVQYRGSRSKIDIVCTKHGIFRQIAANHIQGQGCPSCNAERVGDRRRLTTGDFIRRARRIHKNKFDYSKVKYAGCCRKVIIVCKKHGDFETTPSEHLKGFGGCPSCCANLRADRRRLTTSKFISKAIKPFLSFVALRLQLRSKARLCGSL